MELSLDSISNLLQQEINDTNDTLHLPDNDYILTELRKYYNV